MSYYRDTASGDNYFAVAVLTNASHPDKPPLVVSVTELLREKRFLPIEVADTFGPSYRAHPLSPE